MMLNLYESFPNSLESDHYKMMILSIDRAKRLVDNLNDVLLNGIHNGQVMIFYYKFCGQIQELEEFVQQRRDLDTKNYEGIEELEDCLREARELLDLYKEENSIPDNY